VSPRQEAMLVGVVIILLAALGLLLSRQYHLANYGTCTTRCEAAFLGAGRPAIEPTLLRWEAARGCDALVCLSIMPAAGSEKAVPAANSGAGGPAIEPTLVRALERAAISASGPREERYCLERAHAVTPKRCDKSAAVTLIGKEGVSCGQTRQSECTRDGHDACGLSAANTQPENGSRWWGRRQWEQSGAGTVRQSVRGHRAGGQGFMRLFAMRFESAPRNRVPRSECGGAGDPRPGRATP
jgi:hypothetical protein